MYNKRRNKKNQGFLSVLLRTLHVPLHPISRFRTGTQQLNASVTTVSARVRTLLDKVVYTLLSLMHYKILLFTSMTSQQISAVLLYLISRMRVDRSQSKRWFYSSRPIVTCVIFPRCFGKNKGSGLKDNQTTRLVKKKKKKRKK